MMSDPYPLAPDKIEIKKEMLSNYQIKIADFYNISIGNVKKLMPNLFDKEKYVLQSITLAKNMLNLIQKKIIKAEKMMTKMEKHGTD